MLNFIKKIFQPSEKKVETVGVAIDKVETVSAVVEPVVISNPIDYAALKSELQTELNDLLLKHRHLMHEVDMYRENLVQLNASKQFAQRSLDFSLLDAYDSEISATQRNVSSRLQMVTNIKEKILTLEAELCNIQNM